MSRRQRAFPIGELATQNVWWAKPESIDSDKQIEAFLNSKFRWQPRLAHTFDWSKDLIYSLRGPRQIGKTTLLKQIIKRFLDEKIFPPDHVFYFDCENLDNRQEIVRVVQTYVNTVRTRSKERILIFLDEVSAIPEWQRAVKFLADSKTLANSTIVVTGSHSMDIKASAERLPGRRGQSTVVLDKLMMPVKFSEYVETLNPDLHKALRDADVVKQAERREALSLLARGSIPEALETLKGFIGDLNGYLQQYLMTGGIPPVIDDYVKHGRIEGSRYRDYVDAVVGDLRRWNKRESYVKQLIDRLVDVLASPVSWNALKKTTDIPHHQTVAEYVEALKDNYTLTYLYRLDPHRMKGPAYEDDKKIYFHDPFVFHALRAWATGGEPYKETLDYLSSDERIGKIVESVVCDHIIRLAFMLSPQKHTFDYTNSIFYWRTEKNREIDFILRANGNYIPIECKFQGSVVSDDLFAIAKFNSAKGSESGIVLTKDIMEIQRNAVILPVTLFLLLA